MKKYLLTFAMGLLLALALAPAAFADDSVPRPDPEYLVVSEDDIPMAPMALSATQTTGSGTQNDPFLIYDADDFAFLMNYFSTYRGTTYVKLMNNIDISSVVGSVVQWDGCWKYFQGEFDGNGKTISGLTSDRFLIYGWVGGTIKNLTVDMKGQAGTLVYLPVSIQNGNTMTYQATEMNGVNIESTTGAIQLTEGNGQANYAPFIFSSGPYFTMQNCKNYADISGSTYAAVFYGYYPLANPLPDDHYYKFIDCENHGDVTYQYAGLIFGNPTGLFYKNYTLEGIKNYGDLRGTETVHFFSSDANSIDAIPSYATEGSFLYEQEAKLPEDQVNGKCPDPNCPKHGNDTDYTGGHKYKGGSLEELKVALNGDNFEVTTSPGVTKYRATIFCYVSEFAYNEDASLSYVGTNRMTINQDITTSASSFIIPEFKDYPVVDGPCPSEGSLQETSIAGLSFIDNEENSCYWWDNSTIGDGEGMLLPDHVWYLNGDKTPGSIQWQVYVSAYDSNDNLLDTAVLDRNGVSA